MVTDDSMTTSYGMGIGGSNKEIVVMVCDFCGCDSEELHTPNIYQDTAGHLKLSLSSAVGCYSYLQLCRRCNNALRRTINKVFSEITKYIKDCKY